VNSGPLIALAGAAVLVFWMLGAYNRMVGLRNAIGAAWQQLDEALVRRGEAVAPLVAALREGLVGEGAALDALLAGQAQVAAAADALRPRPVLAEPAQALVRAEALMGAASARVLALLDLQAELRALEAVAGPLATLREAEPRLAFARQVFNEAVQAYNEAVRQWPTRALARLYGFGTAGRL
jgi:LemA protein